MMKNRLLSCLVVVVALTLFQGVASAKMVSGKISGIDAVTSKLSVSYTDLATSKEEKVEIAVKPETTYSGVASFQDLKEGQEVMIDAAENEGAPGLTASSIKIEAAKEEVEGLTKDALDLASTAVPSEEPAEKKI